MIIDKKQIEKAKNRLGDNNAFMIASILEVQRFDDKNLKGLCPFHDEDTPSFVYNKKNHSMHCFGCGKTVDIIEALMLKGHTFISAVQVLFDETKIKYNFGEHGVATKRAYRYPRIDKTDGKDLVYAYLNKRKISPKTVDYLDIQQDNQGNCVFNYYDTNDVLTTVKYRPSHKIKKDQGEIKTWCQKGADTSPLLFNMNRVNPASPLLITEGELDCASAIESGYLNSVSVPFGANNYSWMEENWDWLEQFDSIIICSDNDEAGNNMRKEVLCRLGSWRTRFVEIPVTFNGRDISDLNELLYYAGADVVMDTILNAKDTPVDSVIDFSDIQNIDLSEMDGIKTGFKELDRSLMKLFYGTFNIVTGINGCVSGDTEYFNGCEWKPISEYTAGDKVLQYNEDGTAELVYPEQYHKYPCDHFWHIKSEDGIDQVVSDEHNVVYLSSNSNINKQLALNVINQHNNSEAGFEGNFITTFQYDGIGVPFTDGELRLICKFICKIYFVTCENFDAICRVMAKSHRDKYRIRTILDAVNIAFSEHCDPEDSELVTFIPTCKQKSFWHGWQCCSQHQLQILSDELLFWYSCILHDVRAFSTSNKHAADFVQFVFTATGRRSVISAYNRVEQMRGNYLGKSVEYTISVADQIHPSLVNVKNKIEIPRISSQDGFKYCFTVPSNMLVLRHDGRINITGNSGKSSFLTQLVCQCLEQGENAFMYSGELPNFQAKNWINFVLAGRRNLARYDQDNVTWYKVIPSAQKDIDAFYRGRLFLYKDSLSHKAEDILNSMEGNARKHGCKLFIIDNMTSVSLGGRERDKFDKQEEFINKLIAFASKFNVVVVLVVHPHKIDTMRRLTKMDVQGISAIIDLAHRILSLYRVQDHDRNPPLNKKGEPSNPPIQCDVICDILKDRMRGYEGKAIELYYDKPSRRFFTSYEDFDYQYKWDSQDYSGIPIEDPPQQLESLPF